MFWTRKHGRQSSQKPRSVVQKPQLVTRGALTKEILSVIMSKLRLGRVNNYIVFNLSFDNKLVKFDRELSNRLP